MLGFSLELVDGTRLAPKDGGQLVVDKSIFALSVADLDAEEDRARLQGFASYYFRTSGSVLLIGGVRVNGSATEYSIDTGAKNPAPACVDIPAKEPPVDAKPGAVELTQPKQYDRSYREAKAVAVSDG